MITETAVYSDEVIIDAPVELVWQILLDFENYEKWNPFCPRAINESLALGSPIDMMVDLGNGLTRQVEYIAEVTAYECIAWATANKPEDPVHAVRSQRLKRLADDRCMYVTVDDFDGPGRAAMMAQFAKPVETGFNRCAYGLKEYAEALYSNTNR